MRTKVKICGITMPEEIIIINQLEVDYIGFVFAKSKRKVTLEKALKLKKQLNSRIRTVAVFVDAPIEQVNRIAKALEIDIVQLHGNETSAYINQINFPVWKAQKVIDRIRVIDNEKIDGYLFDGRNPGSGEPFNWEILKNYREKITSTELILAGGLTKNNVGEAIECVQPTIVDVSSGVEKKHMKNKEMIEEFIRRIKC